MTRLLVSVRGAPEAQTALAGGVDLLDVKEPRRGALGAADKETVQSVLAAAAGRAPVSVALGELADIGERLSRPLPPSVHAAKLGLSGCAADRRWPERWQAWREQLPPATQPVAVVYADFAACDAPRPEDVLHHASAAAIVLVDTFHKDGRSLADLWTAELLESFAERVRATGKLLALAGSLDRRAIPRVLDVGPDIIAVRGAACRGGRDGVVDLHSVEALVALVSNRRSATPWGF